MILGEGEREGGEREKGGRERERERERDSEIHKYSPTHLLFKLINFPLSLFHLSLVNHTLCEKRSKFEAKIDVKLLLHAYL